MAALTLQVQNEAIPLANELLGDIQKKRSDEHVVFCLLTIGEIGRHLYVFIKNISILLTSYIEKSNLNIKYSILLQ